MAAPSALCRRRALTGVRIGLGDDLMATGMAKGAHARGKRIAFGNNRIIKWGPHSRIIFKGNPNIAPPGSERANDLEWVRYYKGHRIYNHQEGNRWIWNKEFRAKPGELYFSADELSFAHWAEPGFIVIEPNVPPEKKHAVNKQWPVDRFEAVAREFVAAGYRVMQFGYPTAKHRLQNAQYVNTPSFRHAAALLQRARLAILPEGGMHHAAAAVGVRAVVLFGGFIPPSVTGYDMHANLTGGAEACGLLERCQHCAEAMAAITADDVVKAADGLLANG